MVASWAANSIEKSALSHYTLRGTVENIVTNEAMTSFPATW